MKAALICFGALLFSVVACGSSDGGDGGGGTGGFNFGGASGSGAAGAGGASTAGASAAGTGAGGAPSGGAPAGGQCSPGTKHDNSTQYDMKLTQCLGYKSTVAGFPTTAADITVDQLELSGSLTAGSPYAISTDLVHVSDGVSWELWGSDGFCGSAEEQLYKHSVATGPVCASFTPKANHNALLLVIWSTATLSYGYASLTDCPSGTCK